jgi:hypothetical protein
MLHNSHIDMIMSIKSNFLTFFEPRKLQYICHVSNTSLLKYPAAATACTFRIGVERKIVKKRKK